jgi:hypothetical protein
MFTDEKAVGEQQELKRGTLKLSQAIMIGAKIRPQVKHRAFAHGGSCALGAAFEGLHGKPWPERDWGIFPWSDVLCDLGAHQISGEQIMSLNDTNGWTREQIADWVEVQGY